MREPGEVEGARVAGERQRSARPRLVSALTRLDAALPISVKLLVPMLVIAVAGGGILALTVYRSEADRIRSDFTARAVRVSHQVHGAAVVRDARGPFTTGDYVDLQHHLDTIAAADPSLVRVDLIQVNGESATTLASTDHGRVNRVERDLADLGDDLRASRAAVLVSHEDTIGDTPTFQLTMPFHLVGQAPFVVAVHMSTVERDQELAALLRNFVLGVGSTVVLSGAALLIGLRILIVRRIELLLAFADRLQSGDLGARVEHPALVNSRDEMLRLALRFNAMAASIEELHAEVEEAATTDELTGLYNRRFTLHTLEREIVRARRSGEPLSVIMADLDGLKQINDRLGHQAGDEAIRYAADALRDALRDSDYAARIGGDELAAVLPNCDEEGLARVLERLHITAIRQATGGGAACTISCGGAVLCAADNADTLLGRADSALYEVKRAGKNGTRIAA